MKKYTYIKIKCDEFTISIYVANNHASFVLLIFFFHLSRDIGCALITFTIVWKRQEIIIGIRNGRTKGETLRAFRNGSANYSSVLVHLPFFSLSLSSCFPFISISKALSLSLSFSLAMRAELARSFNTFGSNVCAGNWKFRAYLPLARPSPSSARFACSPPRI